MATFCSNCTEPYLPAMSHSKQRAGFAPALCNVAMTGGSAQCAIALTISSVTFLASPNSIIVLGMKNNSFSTPA